MLHTTNATASASVSRMRFDVLARRSSRCIISCATSCARVANSSAGDWPGSNVILPPDDVPRAGAISSEYSNAMPLVSHELRKPITILARIAVHAADFRQRLTVSLSDIEHVGRAESDCD